MNSWYECNNYFLYNCISPIIKFCKPVTSASLERWSLHRVRRNFIHKSRPWLIALFYASVLCMGPSHMYQISFNSSKQSKEQPVLWRKITTGKEVLQPCYKTFNGVRLLIAERTATYCLPQSCRGRVNPNQSETLHLQRPTRRSHSKSFIELHANKDSFKY